MPRKLFGDVTSFPGFATPPDGAVSFESHTYIHMDGLKNSETALGSQYFAFPANWLSWLIALGLEQFLFFQIPDAEDTMSEASR